MFRSPCGRQRESPIWKHFVYDAATNKSRCMVLLSGPDARLLVFSKTVTVMTVTQYNYYCQQRNIVTYVN